MRKMALLFILMLSACAPENNGHWLGYVEGESVLIAPPQAGWITSLDVNRGDPGAGGSGIGSGLRFVCHHTYLRRPFVGAPH